MNSGVLLLVCMVVIGWMGLLYLRYRVRNGRIYAGKAFHIALLLICIPTAFIGGYVLTGERGRANDPSGFIDLGYWFYMAYLYFSLYRFMQKATQ